MTNRMTNLVDESLVAGGADILKQGNLQDVMEYRKRLAAQLDLVDDWLVDAAKLIQQTVAGPVEPPPSPRKQTGTPRTADGRREPNKLRNGKITDTWRIWDLLQRHGKPMTRAELIPHTDKMGIKNPESALYSLRVSGHIKRDDGFITLI
jgi:hypothetical protein